MRGKPKIPVYLEDDQHANYMRWIRAWLAERKYTVQALLVSKSNLVAAVVLMSQGPSLICFYIRKLCSLGNGGIVIYYDTDAMGDALRLKIENTFTNWLATQSIT